MKKATRRSSIGLQDASTSVRNFSTRFSLQSFVRRVEKLSENQKNAIKRLGFGHLLQIPFQTLSKNLLVELMDRWSCEKRAFLLVPGEIAMTVMDVALILGLRVTGNPVILREDEAFSELEREYGAAVWNRKIPIASIEERLDSLGESINDDFIRSFLLFTFGTLLFPNANGKVDSRYLSLLRKLDEVCHCAWGAAVLDCMVDWLCKRRETNVQYVGGCLIFLQIWSYEHIDIGRPSLLDCPMGFPRACRWGSIRCRQRQWFTSEFKQLGKNQIVWKLQLTPEELEMDTIKELIEAQSDCEDLAAQRCNVSIDKEDNMRTRLQIMDQWIAEMENESEVYLVREVHADQEDSSKMTMSRTECKDILDTSHNVSKVQGVHMEHPLITSDSSSPIIISDEDDENDLRTREQNMKLKREIDDLRKENQLLKNQLLLSSSLEKQNDILRKEVENLRSENQLSNSLVARLERLVFIEDLNVKEEPSSACNGNGILSIASQQWPALHFKPSLAQKNSSAVTAKMNVLGTKFAKEHGHSIVSPSKMHCLRSRMHFAGTTKNMVETCEEGVGILPSGVVYVPIYSAEANSGARNVPPPIDSNLAVKNTGSMGYAARPARFW